MYQTPVPGTSIDVIPVMNDAVNYGSCKLLIRYDASPLTERQVSRNDEAFLRIDVTYDAYNPAWRYPFRTGLWRLSHYD